MFLLLSGSDMIIDNRYRALTAAVALLLCMALLVSCTDGANNSDILNALESLKNDAQTEQRATDSYRIVIPSDCGSELALYAAELADKIESKTGISTGVAYDIEKVPAVVKTIEIILGNAKRDACAVAFEDVRAKDYVCRYVGNSIVIGGVTEEMTLKAAKRFEEQILPFANAARIMETDGGFEHIDQYKSDALLLCGFDIGDYSIVSNDTQLAKALRDAVADTCGRVLEVLSCDTVDGKKEIIFTIDENATQALISKKNEDVVVSAANTYGLSLATAKLCKMIQSAETGGTARVDVTHHSFLYENTELRVNYSMCNLSLSESELTKIISFAKAVDACGDSVVVMSRMSGGVCSMVARQLSSEWTVVDKGNGICFAYRNKTVRLVDTVQGNTDGLVSCDARFSLLASGQTYTVSVLLSDGTEAAEAHAKAHVSELGDAMVCYSGLSADGKKPNISGEGAVMLRSDHVTLGKLYYNCVTLTVGENTAAVADMPSLEGYMFSTSIALGVKYAPEFLELLQNMVEK